MVTIGPLSQISLATGDDGSIPWCRHASRTQLSATWSIPSMQLSR